MPLFSSRDIDQARQRVQETLWAKAIFAAVRARADAWLAQPADVLTLAGGWIHDYVCPEHWNALIFDLASPQTHRCLHGETRTGAKLDAAWRVIEHRRIATAARDLALIFVLTNESVYADAGGKVLAQYAQCYDKYVGADDARTWMLKGHVFNQALSEAIWAVPIVQAYSLVHNSLPSSQDTHIVNGLLHPIARTLSAAQDELVQQGRLKSNYNAWLIAALGLLGYALGDNALVKREIDGPSGFRAHLTAAILSDGFEHEGTPYYHNFVTLAYTIFAEAARANGRDLYSERGPDGQSIELMWRSFASLAFADGSIPQINDGAYHWGGPFATEICETYEVAFARTGNPEFAWLLNRNYGGGPRDIWSALLFATQDIANAPVPCRPSVCLKRSGIAVLRDDTNAQQACVPFGSYAGSHSHLDRLGIQVYPWSTDAGTPPYGVEARVSWYQQSAAHNVVVVDGKSQVPCAGQLLNWIVLPELTLLWLSADAAYAGVRFSRLLTLTNGILKDWILLNSETDHTYDWILHLDGSCRFDGLALNDAQGMMGNDGAYQFVTLVARRGCMERFQFTVPRVDKTFRVTLSADVPFEIILARSPAHVSAPTQARQTIIARASNHHVSFTMNSELVR